MSIHALLAHWLRAKATESLYQAARENVDRAQSDSRHCDVGIVFALGEESAGLEDRMGDTVTIKGSGFAVRQGELKGRRVALMLSGTGREAAFRGTTALISGHRPAVVISAGFAGGLREEVKRGDFVLASSLIDTNGNTVPLDLNIDRESIKDSPRLHVGRLLTVDRIVAEPVEKKALGEKLDVLAVDMESLAVAEVCRREKVPMLAIRVISDAVDDKLPRELQRLVDQPSTLRRLGAATGAIWRRPSSLKEMWKLKEDALVASDRLAVFLERIVAELPAIRSDSG